MCPANNLDLRAHGGSFDDRPNTCLLELEPPLTLVSTNGAIAAAAATVPARDPWNENVKPSVCFRPNERRNFATASSAMRRRNTESAAATTGTPPACVPKK
jgi:hypothetical protein